MKASTDSTTRTQKTKHSLKWPGWLEMMKALDEKHPKLSFWGRVAGFYFLMMVLFLYFMLANLSSAPKFVYTQF
jgi:hypothetical protein